MTLSLPVQRARVGACVTHLVIYFYSLWLILRRRLSALFVDLMYVHACRKAKVWLLRAHAKQLTLGMICGFL
jgi:hypothetical protein